MSAKFNWLVDSHGEWALSSIGSHGLRKRKVREKAELGHCGDYEIHVLKI